MQAWVTRRRFVLHGSSAGLAAGMFAALPHGLLAAPQQSVGTLLQQHRDAPHPRLHLHADQWRTLATNVEGNPILKRWFDRVSDHAETLLKRPPAQYRLKGPRLLYESRAALDTISTLSGMYRLDGDQRKADRAREELRAICAFPSWHPPHFLDVAEMTNAAALGYDWLYDVLSDDERRTIRKAIVEFGIRPGLKEYRSGVKWSLPYANNWGQVCAGGLTTGALAIAHDDEAYRAEVEELLTFTTGKVRNCMLNYAPDGGWPEGPVYWDYATRYTCFMLSALQSALGTDLGISTQPGFDQTGNFRMDAQGPTGKVFNYADADEHGYTAPCMLFLGSRFHRPDYVAHERGVLDRLTPNIFHLIWADPALLNAQPTDPPNDRIYSRVNVAFFRSSWKDSQALFAGIKGGDNGASHSHLDLGTFVLEAMGERWAIDLGPDDYDLPGYFGAERYSYYRLQSRGHNTLTLAAANQELDAAAPMSGFETSAASGRVRINLTQAYRNALKKAERTATLERSPHQRFVLEDRVVTGEPTQLIWAMHTTASVTLNGREATLSLNGKQLRLRIESADGPSFSVMSHPAEPVQGLPDNVTRLMIPLKLAAGETLLRVVMEPA